MEQPAVGDGVKPLRQRTDGGGFHFKKIDRQPAGTGFVPGRLQRIFQKIDARHCATAFGQPQRQFPRAAPHIEHAALYRVSHSDEGRLRAPDIPRHLRRGIVGFKPGPLGGNVGGVHRRVVSLWG